MILRPRTRPQSILQAFSRAAKQQQHQQHQHQPAQSIFRVQQTRSEHTVPDLGNNNEKGLSFQEHGVPGFLTPKTYRQTWLQYQQYLCDEVNSTTEGLTKYANMKPLELHVTLSHNPEHASLYNHAAMLHFNHFFWESLMSSPSSRSTSTSTSSPTSTTIPTQLEKNIIEDFSSVEDLRVELLQHADAMFGNGFVWLVKEGSNVQNAIGYNMKNPPLRILCTYNAGSPYTEAHQRRQSHDMATTAASDPLLGARLAATGVDRLTRVQNSVGSFGNHSKSQPRDYPNALHCQPILCLNNWQHMYMLDYGILGKRAYLAAWWESIDWNVVFQRYTMETGVSSGMAHTMRQMTGR